MNTPQNISVFEDHKVSFLAHPFFLGLLSLLIVVMAGPIFYSRAFTKTIDTVNYEALQLAGVSQRLATENVSSLNSLNPYAEEPFGFKYGVSLLDRFFGFEKIGQFCFRNFKGLSLGQRFYIDYFLLVLAIFTGITLLGFRGLIVSLIFLFAHVGFTADAFIYPFHMSMNMAFPLLVGLMSPFLQARPQKSWLLIGLISVSAITLLNQSKPEMVLFGWINLILFAVYYCSNKRVALKGTGLFLLGLIVSFGAIYLPSLFEVKDFIRFSARLSTLKTISSHLLVTSMKAFIFSFYYSPLLRISGGIIFTIVVLKWLFKRMNENTTSVIERILLTLLLGCFPFSGQFSVVFPFELTPDNRHLNYFNVRDFDLSESLEVMLSSPALVGFILSMLAWSFIQKKRYTSVIHRFATWRWTVWVLFLIHFFGYFNDFDVFRIGAHRSYYHDFRFWGLQFEAFLVVWSSAHLLFVSRTDSHIEKIARASLLCIFTNFFFFFYLNAFLFPYNMTIQGDRNSYFTEFWLALIAGYGWLIFTFRFYPIFRSSVHGSIRFIFIGGGLIALFGFAIKLIPFYRDLRFRSHGIEDSYSILRKRGQKIGSHLHQNHSGLLRNYRVYQDLCHSKWAVHEISQASLSYYLPHRMFYGYDSYMNRLVVALLWPRVDWEGRGVVYPHWWPYFIHAVKRNGIEISSNTDYRRAIDPFSCQDPPISKDVFDATGTRWVLSKTSELAHKIPFLIQRGKWSENSEDLYVYENSSAFPHSRLVQECTGFVSDGTQRNRPPPIPRINQRECAIYGSKFSPPRKQMKQTPLKDSDVKEEGEASHFVVHLPDLKTSAILVTTEFFQPQWKAYVANTEREVASVNGYFLGVKVSPGDHEVRFSFDRSLSFLAWWNPGLSVCGVLFLLMGTWLIIREQKAR